MHIYFLRTLPLKDGKKKPKWWSRKSYPSSQQKMKTSRSWDSSVTKARYDEDVEIDDDMDSNIPEPPPLPTVEFLLGKRAVNLRKRINQSLKDQLKERAAHLKKTKAADAGAADSDESDSHSSVASSRGSSKGRRHSRRASRHKKKRREEGEDGKMDWSYNKLSTSSLGHSRKERRPMDSPSRRKKIMERKPTPLPSKVPMSDIRTVPSSAQQRLNFDAFDEMNKVLEHAIHSVSPSSTSPLNSPSSQSSPSSSLETSPLHVAHTSTGTAGMPPNAPPSSTANPSPGILRNKRGGPKLQPHLQNKQVTQQISKTASQHTQNGLPGGSQVPRSAPIAKIGNNRNKLQQGVLLNSSPTNGRGPQLSRQHGQIESSSGDPDLTIDDMELQLAEMKTRLVHASANSMQGNIRPPSTEVHNTSEEEEETDSETDESSEYTSSSETTTSSDSDDTTDSSDEEVMKKPMTPKRLTMVRNPAGVIGGAAARGRSGGTGGGANQGFNRLRMLTRYPKLFRKRIINLDTIAEQAEEVVFEYVSQRSGLLQLLLMF